MLFFAPIAVHQQNAPANDILSKEALSCRDWAIVANGYIALGEQRAIARLTAGKPLAPLNTRKCLLCRILFVPKGAKPLEPPALGGLEFPFHSTTLQSWPEFPFVQQNGIWFLLSEHYTLGGYPEQVAWYINKCQKSGDFRRLPIKVPTASEATQALDRFFQSERWKMLDWKELDLSQGDTLSRMKSELQAQTFF